MQEELAACVDSLVKFSILQPVQNKFQVNSSFNGDKKQKFISLLPSADEMKKQDQAKIEALNLSSISGKGTDIESQTA